jgi:replicative DNA helicase
MAISPTAHVPPHNLDAEQSVLGAILLSERSIYGLVIEEGLRPEDFYRDQHGLVFRSMLDLYNASEPIDVVTVTDRLKQGGVLDEAGGAPAVAGLAAAAPAAGNARHYAQIVRNDARMRRLLTAAYEIQAKVLGHEETPDVLMEQAERAVLDVAHDERQKDFKSIEDVLLVELDKLHRLSLEKTSLTGTPSGFKEIDDITGGFQPGNLIVLAARPSMGKSALVTNIAENAALNHGRPVALFSLEMSEAELAQRFIASQAKVKGELLRKGKAEPHWSKINDASQRLASAPLFVDDSSDIGILEVRAKARRLHAQQQSRGGLGLIIVDYLQLMRADGRIESRVQQVGEMSRGLKILARELEVPVIALSQLSRAVEQRAGDKKPILSDLRDSGNIEQDADLVMFIYRDEYYNKDSEREGEADIIISKHRNGALGEVTLNFQKEFPRFMNLARENRYAA